MTFVEKSADILHITKIWVLFLVHSQFSLRTKETFNWWSLFKSGQVSESRLSFLTLIEKLFESVKAYFYLWRSKTTYTLLHQSTRRQFWGIVIKLLQTEQQFEIRNVLEQHAFIQLNFDQRNASVATTLKSHGFI